MKSFTVLNQTTDYYNCLNNETMMYQKVFKYNPYILEYQAKDVPYLTLFLFNKMVDKDKFLNFHSIN
jgi:hypothetical protein